MTRPDTKNVETPKKEKKWIEYFLAPLITALILFILQFFYGPILEKKKTIASDIWLQKKETIIRASELVNEKYQTLKFNSSDTSIGVFTNFKDVNNTYFRLLLLCKNEEIAAIFWHFFDNSTTSFTPVQRGEFISLLKKELIGIDLKTPTNKIPILK